MKLTEHNEKVLQKFSEMMIERMQQVKGSKFKQPWLGMTRGGAPVNVEGNSYRGGNVFMLMLDSAMHDYEFPIYCTVKQANRLGGHINKGEHGMPVIYWDFSCKDEHGQPMKHEDYKKLSYAECEKCECIPFLKSYVVFNIDQTNLAEVKPDKVDNIKASFISCDVKDDKGMYANAAIDDMLAQQSWLCTISYEKVADGAFYSPSHDKIVVPKKAQFKTHRKRDDVYVDGQKFYSTLLHEMVHSTGTPERLNRNMQNRFGDPKYAKEELVAELGAARICQELGFNVALLDNSAAYLDSWIEVLKKEPTFILTVMTDVEKASRLILDKLAA